MSAPQHLIFGVGGTLEITLASRPSSATVNVYDGNDSVVFSGKTATVSSINTTLSSAATAGATTLSVASNTGIAVGSTFLIEDDPEEVLVRKVSGSTVTLRRPIVYDHVNGASVTGSRVYYTASSTDANKLFWDGRAEWNIAGSIYDYTAVECTKYPMHRLASAQDVFDEDPKFYQILDSEADVDRLLDLAHGDVLTMIAEKAPDSRARVFTGSTEFVRATVFAFMRNWYRRQASDEAQRLFERYQTALESELARVCGVVPRDSNQDGTIEASEKMSFRTVTLRRA